MSATTIFSGSARRIATSGGQGRLRLHFSRIGTETCAPGPNTWIGSFVLLDGSGGGIEIGERWKAGNAFFERRWRR